MWEDDQASMVDQMRAKEDLGADPTLGSAFVYI